MRLNPVTRPSATATGTTTSGSAVVTVPDTSLLAGALAVSGAGIPMGAFVETIDSATQLTLSANATANGSASLAFTLEPIGLAEAKLHLKDILDEENSLVAALIVAARERCELEVKRSFIATVWDLFYDQFPVTCATSYLDLPEQGAIAIPRTPLISVDSVNYWDLGNTSQVVDPDQYEISEGTPARIAPTALGRWPIPATRIDGVRIRFTAGYGPTADAVPDTAKVAIKLLLSFLYENRGDATADMPAAVSALLASLDWGSYT